MRISTKISSFLFMACCIFPSTSLADHVLPVFSGMWYEYVEFYGTTDSCGVRKYKYYHTGSSPAEAVRGTLVHKQRGYRNGYDRCAFSSAPYFVGNSSVSYKGYNHPDDFFYAGRGQADWNTMTENGGPQMQLWRSDCIDDKDGHIWYTEDDIIQPSYKCPEGSRLNSLDGCTTTPEPCAADILGRDLNFPGLGWVGHVGFASGYWGSYVIETLNESPNAIQKNTFDSFKRKTSFWGEKYGLPNRPDLTQDEAFRIEDAAIYQMQCETVIYSPNARKTHPCRKQPKGTFEAVFRCDTLVSFAYLNGAGIDIRGGRPKDLFKLFLNYRDMYDTTSINNSYASTLQKANPVIAVANDASSQEQTMADAIAKDPVDLDLYGKAEGAYLHNQAVSRDRKIRFLWSLAVEYRQDETRFGIIIDDLGDLYPAELTDQFINEYYKQISSASKVRLMDILASSAGMIIHDTSGKYNPKYENLQKIRQFFSDMLFNSKDKSIIKDAIFFYDYAFDAEKAKTDVDKVFTRTDIDSSTLKKEMFLDLHFYTHQLEWIFAIPATQTQNLANLLKTVEEPNTNRWPVFNDSLHNYLNNSYMPELAKEFYSNKVSTKTKKLLLSYLERHKPNPLQMARPPFAAINSIRKQYEWLESYIAIQSKDIDEKYKNVARYIKETKDLPYKSALLSVAPDQVYNRFTLQDVRELMQELEQRTTFLQNAKRQNPRNLSMRSEKPERSGLYEDEYVGFGQQRVKKHLISRESAERVHAQKAEF